MGLVIPEGEMNLAAGIRGSFQNVVGKWCNIIQPNTKGKFGAQWTISIYITAEEAEWFRSCGFGKKVTEDQEKDNAGNMFVNGKFLLHLSQACNAPDGTSKRAPMYVGADGRTPMVEDFGIGSILNVDFKMMAKGDGKFPVYLNAVQVIGLVQRQTCSFTDTTQAPPALPEGCVLATPDVIGAAAATQAAQPGPATPVQPGPATPVQPGVATPVQPGVATTVQPGPATPVQPGVATTVQPGSTAAPVFDPNTGQQVMTV